MATASVDTFPFLVRHQVVAQDLQKLHPVLHRYDVASDWRNFVNENEHMDVFQKLRQFRQSRLAFIALSDFPLVTDKHCIAMEKTSQLADFLLQQALKASQSLVEQRFGAVMNAGGHSVPFAVLALGKLGTKELNYSSDVDLVFVCGGEGQSNGGRSLDSGRYFERLGRQLIKLLDQFTSDGRVYRVDMRLRPFGSAAPLVCTSAALQNYIITEGREWERFAWMRARFVAGDAVLGQSVISDINPFIYRKHLDYSVFDSLAKIKRDMVLSAQEYQQDLKLGAGGIREIEFIVQSLQVTFGGRIAALQGVSIGPQFEQLLLNQKIKPDNANALKAAWLFMRRLENLCQIQNDEQTHVVPADEELKKALAQIMDCEDWNACELQWQHHRERVKQMFSVLFASDDEVHHLADGAARWVHQTMAMNFSQKMSQDRADQMQRLLERACELADVEDLALGLLPILKAIIRRPSYVLMLLQEKRLLPALLDLVAKSDYFVKIWVLHPALLELLFEPELLPDVVDVDFYQAEWLQEGSENLDEEQWMEAVRFFKHKQQFKLVQSALMLGLPDSYLRNGFSSLATFFVGLVVEKGWLETNGRLGDCGIQVGQMMVLAYGSLGVSHMAVNSDLDLVLVVDADVLTPDQMQFLQRWAKRISHHLMVKMFHGVLYDIDLQLRPNGNAGALVTSRNEFESYQNNEAWIWEHAALIKARLIGANEKQQHWFTDLKKKLLCQTRSAEKVRVAMQGMADKLAQFGSQNHRNDLLFLEHLLIALPDHPVLLNAESYTDLLKQSEDLGVVPGSMASELRNQKRPI